MPNYDYKCETCGNSFEVFQSMNDAKLTACPVEGCAGPVKRLLGTGGAIIFKGSGFYQTDYRSSNYQAGAKAESGSGKSDGGSGKSEGGSGKSEGGSGKSEGGSGKSEGGSSAPSAPAASTPKAAG